MFKVVLGVLAVGAIMAGIVTMASASPATPLLGSGIMARAGEVQHVAYYWNHRRYYHRSWDKRHRRWRYY
jgi:hypothetical protein